MCPLTRFEKSEAGGTIDGGRVSACSRGLWRCWRWRSPAIGRIGQAFANEGFRGVKDKPEIADVHDSRCTARVNAPNVENSFSPVRIVDVAVHDQVTVESKFHRR